MPVTQYIGSRYVPLFADPAEWSSAKEYEPLTIVLHEGNSFTSKQFVPVGIDISNEAYWAQTGNYNAQVEQYRRETNVALSTAQAAQIDIDTLLPKADFTPQETVKQYIDNSVEVLREDIDNSTRYAVKNATIAPILFAGRLLDRYGYESTVRVLSSQSVVYDSGYYYSCGSFNNNATQTIVKFDSNGRIVNSNNYTNLYHANSITAIDNYLVVASGDGLKLHLINKSTLSYVTTISFISTNVENILSICAENNIVYMRCRDGAYNNYIYSTNVTVGDFTIVASLGKQDASVAQGFAFKDGYAYLMNNFRNLIYVYDVDSTSLIKTYVLPDGDGLYPIGEPEDLFFYEDRLMFNSAEYYPASIEMQAALTFIFDAGITLPTNQSGTNPQSDTYTNITVDGNASTIFKPYNSFNTVEEASIIVNYRGSAYITLSNLNTGTIRLNRGNHFIVGSSSTVSIKAFYSNLANIVMRRIALAILNFQYGTLTTHDVTIENMICGFSTCKFNNLTISDNGTIDATKCNLEYRGIVTLPDNATVVQKNASSKCSVDILVLGSSKWAYKLLRSNGVDRAAIIGVSTGGMLGGGIQLANYLSDTGFTINVSGYDQFTTLSYDATGQLMFDSTASSSYPIHILCV